MKKVRISLGGLLILVTAIVLFLGFSQYRRQEILKVCGELDDYGYFINVPNEWHDRMWQRKPRIEASFYAENRILLLMDLENEEGTTIANLEAIGVTPGTIEESERQRVEAARKRVEMTLKRRLTREETLRFEKAWAN